MNRKLFRESCIQRVSSPDQLNDYIRVSTPSVWIVLAAAFVLLAAILFWGVTGSLPTKVEAVGVAREGGLICYLSQEDAAKVKPGMAVQVGSGDTGTVAVVGTNPLSQEEVAKSLTGDYTAHAMGLSEWNIAVTIRTDQELLSDQSLYQVTVVTESIHPIDFLLDGQGAQS